MFQSPMTLKDIAQLASPSDRVPAEEHLPYEEALGLIEDEAFTSYYLPEEADGRLQLSLTWKDPDVPKLVNVRIVEDSPRSALKFSCSLCLEAGRHAQSCKHQWASYVLLWQALGPEKEEIHHPELSDLSKRLHGPDFLGATLSDAEHDPEFAGIKLDSLSLFLEDIPLLKGDELQSLLSIDLGKYKKHDVRKEEERRVSPRLWNLPEIFRKKLTAYSEHYFNEVNEQNRMTDILRYNFSNGVQISAKEILRHPLHRIVNGDLLPQAKSAASIFAKWPLLQKSSGIFVSQSMQELEEIMQALLDKVTTEHRRGKIELFLQTKSHPGRALKIQSIGFEPKGELFWRVEFTEKTNGHNELETEFKLMNFRKKPMFFFESVALEVSEGALVVHPWRREFGQLQEALSALDENLRLSDREMPCLEISGELETKSILKYLRSRAIPVEISGESRHLEAHKSLTEIRLAENGTFYIQHEARIHGQKNLVRRGWTSRSALFLQTLSKGLALLLGTDARNVASRNRSKRDWDLKLLKHLGILQYVVLEALSYHFEGHLTDGRIVDKKEIFSSLSEKIQGLLIAGTGGVFVSDVPLSDLCSKPVLSCFEDFIDMTLKSIKSPESFYSAEGELVLEGVVDREFRLLYELLKKMAVASGGETFKKSRTSFLAKITNGEMGDDLQLSTANFHFPTSGTQLPTVHESLESLQALIQHGFKIFYRDQILQELNEDEFHVDFILQSEGDQKFFNWFELNPKFFLRGEEVDPENFLKLGGGGVIEYEGKLFLVPRKQMPSLKRLENFWLKLQKGKVEADRQKNGLKIYHLPRSQTLELLALRSSGVGLRGDREWDRLCAFYDSLGTKTRELNLPASMKAELKPYQALGVQWLQDLYGLRLGALLADDMGLGKTLQSLCFLDDLRAKGELGQVLVVVPSSLIFNWQQEVEKFTPELPLMVFSSKDKDSLSKKIGAGENLVVITTYGLLMENQEYLTQYNWNVLIFDEAQNLKNITTKRTSAARSLNARFKICLTGTPMENHYGEFYSLVDILVPGSLGEVDDFRRQFVNTEMVTREEMQDLKLKIKPLLLRRTKKEILDQLPEKQETKVSIAFEERQKEIYRDIALSYNQRVQETMEVQGVASVQLQMLTALLRLRQACSDPAALPNVKYDKVPPKLETLLDSLKEIVESGESALVFTQFLQTLEHTTEILKKAGIPVFNLHGGIPTKQRQKIFADFNALKGGGVLVMTLKTGGVGLNLTKASYVFHLEPWWNPSVENQATDRAHRLGQNKAVQVFRYIMHESLEEKIELLKDRKDRKFQSLFSDSEKVGEPGGGGGGGSLSKQDFDMLLGLK